MSSFDRPQQTLLTLREQTADAANIFERQSGLLCDLRIGIATLFHATDVMEQVDGVMLAPWHSSLPGS